MTVVNKLVTQCGASLIGHYFALTAAHCQVYASFHLLQAGSVDAYDHKNLYDISETHKHPRFDHKTDRYDIQLLCIDGSVTYTPNIKPINIPDFSEDFVNKSVVVVGSGVTDDETASYVVRKLNATIIPIERCIEEYPKISERLKEEVNYCTDRNPPHGACFGDSGGPLVYTRGQSQYIVGIVSYGKAPCGLANTPDVYTNIKVFNGTFDKIIKNYVAEKEADVVWH